MKNKQKGFGFMVVLIIIALLGVAGEGVFLAVKSKEKVTLTPNVTTPLMQNYNQTTSQNTPVKTAVDTKAPSATSSLVYTQSSGLYSFTYPKTSGLNPNFTILVGNKGFYSVPPNVSPNTLYIPSDPNTVQYTGVSLEIFGSASAIVANFAILADSNNTLLNKILAVTKNGGVQYIKSSFGNVSGFPVDVYTISTATAQGQIAYVINLGQYQNTTMSLVILDIGSTPPLAKNIPTVETFVRSFVINSSVVQKYLQSLPALLSKASDASITSKFMQARMDAETYSGKQSNYSYSGFCTSSNFIIIKNSVSPASVSCQDSVTAYAASVQLSGGYLCFDSTG